MAGATGRTNAMPALRDHHSLSRVAVIGAGLIGSGWATQYLQAGFEVAAWDPAPGWRDRLRNRVRSALARLRVDPVRQAALLQNMSFAGSCEKAVANADFVQESGPEDADIKRSLLARICAVAPADVVIASSTSGLSMTDLQARCIFPSRLAVGHPFNPVYLMPLVEVAGGRHTSAEVIDWLAGFYRGMGKEAIICHSENMGFIANRLQEALFREALHMVAAGEATVHQIDRAVCHGPGFRWAFMGPFLTYHAAGGRGGMRAFFESFGATLAQPYSRLSAPALNRTLQNKVVRACDAAYGRFSMEEIDAWRDRNLQFLKTGLRPNPGAPEG